MNCKPIIKSFHSPDVSDLPVWRPHHQEHVFVLVELSIGPHNQNGADIFQIVVCTPEALRREEKLDTDIIVDRALLVVKQFRWGTIEKHLETVVASCEDRSWVEVSQKLQRFFHWEYEDYVEEVIT